MSRMSGGLTLLPLYALMVWTWATLPVPTVVQSSVAWKSVRILYLIKCDNGVTVSDTLWFSLYLQMIPLQLFESVSYLCSDV